MSSTLKDVIQKYQNDKYVYLSNCLLTGQIPDSIGNLSYLTELLKSLCLPMRQMNYMSMLQW